MRTLHADGMQLEPQCAAHAQEMFALLAEPAIHAYLDSPPPASVEVLRHRFELLESRASLDGREHWLNWVIRLDSGVLAGFIQATVCADGLAWIAFVLGSAHWGQGIAQRATRAAMDDCAARYGATHWLATADRGNERSIRLLSRLGFTPAPEALRAEHEVADTDVLLRLIAAPAQGGPARGSASAGH
jgi:[ribosomal protein S5]-alanine N-acetyltransferase